MIFVDFSIIQIITVNSIYPGDSVWIRDYGKVNTKWIEDQVVKKISDVMYDVKFDCNNSTIQRHVDQLRYMPVMMFMAVISNINPNH